MRTLFTLVITLITPVAFAQNFRGEAPLPAVQSDGFYRIIIPPGISPHVNGNFSNIRIYDGQKEVPYLFQQENPVQYTQVFKEYVIVEKKQQKNCCTFLILSNPSSQAINNINLSIKNAEVTKMATLLGSDDKENWFALKERFTLSSINNKNQTSEIKIVDFPLSNYNYYLIQIEDSTSAPLNILSAGYYEVNSEDGTYTEINSFKTTKADDIKSKQSFIRITFDTTQVVDKLSVGLSGAPYFLRRASLSIKKERLNKKKEKEIFYEWLSYFELSSKQPSILELPGIQANEFLITVENDDNPVLEIAAVKTYQLNRYLTAWLKKDIPYTIKLGDINQQSPTYDIGFFKDSIPNQPPTLAMGAITIFKEDQSQSPTFFTNRAIIWVAIVVVIVVLGFMLLKLVGEAGKSDKQE